MYFVMISDSEVVLDYGKFLNFKKYLSILKCSVIHKSVYRSEIPCMNNEAGIFTRIFLKIKNDFFNRNKHPTLFNV